MTGRVLASEEGAPSVNHSNANKVFRSLPLKGDHFAGGNFGTAIATFEDSGPFDETELLRYCEDPEWSYRALVKGHEIHFIPEITVIHLHWRGNADMTRGVFTVRVLSGRLVRTPPPPLRCWFPRAARLRAHPRSQALVRGNVAR